MSNQSTFGVTDDAFVAALEPPLEGFKTQFEAKMLHKKPLEYGEFHQQLFDGVLATGKNTVTIAEIIDSNGDRGGSQRCWQIVTADTRTSSNSKPKKNRCEKLRWSKAWAQKG